MALNTTVASTSNRSDDHPDHAQIIEDLNWEERNFFAPVLVFYVLVMVVGLIGNALVVAVYVRCLKRSSARVYIISLAILDFSVCLVGIPYHVLDLTFHYTYTFTAVCKLLSCLMGILNFASVFVLNVVAIDRYFKVCRPLKRQVVDFGSRKACGIAVAMAVLVAWPSGVLYGNSRVETRISGVYGVQCFIDDGYDDTDYPFAFLALVFFCFLATIVFLVVLYYFICRTIYLHMVTQEPQDGKQRTRCGCNCGTESSDDSEEDEDIPMTNLEGSQSAQTKTEILSDLEQENGENMDAIQHAHETVAKEALLNNTPTKEGKEKSKNRSKSKRNDRANKLKSTKSPAPIAITRHRTAGKKGDEKQTRKITLMMFTITIVFIISYLPYIVISLLDAMDTEFWDDMSKAQSLLYELFLRTYLFNNIANPIIYGFWDLKFRKECVRLIRRVLCCYHGDASAGSSTSSSGQYTTTSTAFTKCTGAA